MLTQIIEQLLELRHPKDKPLRKGLILCWRPPHTILITRRQSVAPSPEELETVTKNLTALGYTTTTSPLQTKPNGDGTIFYYYQITIAKQLSIL